MPKMHVRLTYLVAAYVVLPCQRGANSAPQIS